MRFGLWNEILSRPVPDGGYGRFEMRIAHVLALIATTRLAEVEAELRAYDDAERSMPPGATWWADPLERFTLMVRNEMVARPPLVRRRLTCRAGVQRWDGGPAAMQRARNRRRDGVLVRRNASVMPSSLMLRGRCKHEADAPVPPDRRDRRPGNGAPQPPERWHHSRARCLGHDALTVTSASRQPPAPQHSGTRDTCSRPCTTRCSRSRPAP